MGIASTYATARKPNAREATVVPGHSIQVYALNRMLLQIVMAFGFIKSAGELLHECDSFGVVRPLSIAGTPFGLFLRRPQV